MHPNSLFSIRHWTLSEILFVGSACFAIGAVGFFLAVYLQLKTIGPADAKYANSASLDDKVRVMNILAQNAATPENTSNVAPTESQAAADDALAAQKLKMLEKLNTQ